MGEKGPHRLMKRAVGTMLEEDGYTVEYEKDLGDCVADVYAENSLGVRIVEVGRIDNSRADKMRDIADEFIHIPYTDIAEYDAATRGSNGNKRVNLYVDESEWNEFKEKCGQNSLSETVRGLVSLYNRLK